MRGSETAEEQKQQQEFGRYLRDLRKGKGFNQSQLAEQIQITSGYYGFFEQGRQIPSLKIINQLADALGADYFEMAQKAGYDEFEAKKKYRQPEDGTKDVRSGGKAIDGGETATTPEGADNPQEADSVEDSADGGAEQCVTGSANIPNERLNWALLCIRKDPEYRLADHYKTGSVVATEAALLVQLYQTQTRRHLLTTEEAQALGFAGQPV